MRVIQMPEDAGASFTTTLYASKLANKENCRVEFTVLDGHFKMYIDPGENPHTTYNTRGPYTKEAVKARNAT